MYEYIYLYMCICMYINICVIYVQTKMIHVRIFQCAMHLYRMCPGCTHMVLSRSRGVNGKQQVSRHNAAINLCRTAQ